MMVTPVSTTVEWVVRRCAARVQVQLHAEVVGEPRNVHSVLQRVQKWDGERQRESQFTTHCQMPRGKVGQPFLGSLCLAAFAHPDGSRWNVGKNVPDNLDGAPEKLQQRHPAAEPGKRNRAHVDGDCMTGEEAAR